MITGAKSDVALDGHLVQVGTGEGKSILLGTLSCLLGLMGYEVSCASYSKHLSSRDYESFRPLFAAFGLSSTGPIGGDSGAQIRYSTLAGLAEAVINSTGNVRDMVTQRFGSGDADPSKGNKGGKGGKKGTSHKTVKRILIIDEVDVFFSEDFYGVTYNPIARFSCEETNAIMQFIWDNNANIQLETVQRLPAYGQLLSKISVHFKRFLDQQILFMLDDAKDFRDPVYEVIDDEFGGKVVGYKDQDSVNTSLNYRYKTAFAYLHESNVHQSMVARLPDMLGLQLPCGRFSFAEIPQTKNFTCIMGVTGTLSCLSASEMGIIRDEYNIKKTTIMPSIYGGSKLKFAYKDVDVILESDRNRYHQLILEDIKRERDRNRAVLVYFRDEAAMKEFVASDYGKQMTHNGKNFYDVVTERTDNISFYVDKATSSEAVTLFPKVFGRGLDFISRDDVVVDAGGIHVIQTFFSDFESEEIQIKGRTARQAQEGSFKMILFQGDLERDFEVTPDEVAASYPSQSFYDTFLKRKRDRKVLKAIEGLKEKAVTAKSDNAIAETFIQRLLSGAKTEAIASMMSGFNASGASSAHIVFCLDESGSMTPHWGSLLQALGDFLTMRADAGAHQDLISVIQFASTARLTMDTQSLADARSLAPSLKLAGGGTLFVPPLNMAKEVVKAGPDGMDVFVVFMTDGAAGDNAAAEETNKQLCLNNTKGTLSFYGIAFSDAMNNKSFESLITCVGGQRFGAANVVELRNQFNSIARAVEAQQAGK